MKIFNVLIIDDHQIIIDTYKKAICLVENELKNYSFKIVETKDCQGAYNKIKNCLSKDKDYIVFLDILLPKCYNCKINSGECLGKLIRDLIPKVKIIVSTGYSDNLRLKNIFKTINPEGFLIKSDIDFVDIVNAIRKVINDEFYYSQTVLSLLANFMVSDKVLDEFDIQILKEISNGAKMKELVELVPLTKSGIEKRRRLLRNAFNIKTDSDRELILAAKEKGFI